MYCTGTTGSPKGVMMSHGNFVAAVATAVEGREFICLRFCFVCSVVLYVCACLFFMPFSLARCCVLPQIFTSSALEPAYE